MNFQALLSLFPLIMVSLFLLPAVLVLILELSFVVQTMRRPVFPLLPLTMRERASLAWADFKFGMGLFAACYASAILHYVKVIASWSFMVPLVALVGLPLGLIKTALDAGGSGIQRFADWIGPHTSKLCVPALRSIGRA